MAFQDLMDCLELMGKEEKRDLRVRKENQGKKENKESLVQLEKHMNLPMMSLLRDHLVLLALQDPLDLWDLKDLLDLKGPPGQGTTELTYKPLILWGCCMQSQMMKL